MSRLLLCLCVSPLTFLAAAPRPQNFGHPVVFEPNHGQAPAEVKWLAHATGYQLFLTGEGVTIALPPQATKWVRADASALVLLNPRNQERSPVLVARPPNASAGAALRELVRMKLTGSRAWNAVTGLEPTGGSSNYFLGNDPKRWRTDIPHYTRLRAAGVYDGIDLVFYSNGSDLEYDFVLAAEADPNQIRVAFEGIDHLRVDGKSGDLLLETASGFELRHLRPKVYQEIGGKQVEVAAGYQLLDRRQATFTLAAYDRRRPLMIDPTVRFTTLLSGNSADEANEIAVDSAGNAYITGSTISTNFPVAGNMQGDQPGPDAFVTKLSASGAIMFSTYLGGSGRDVGSGIAVDSTGVYITGDTDSRDFPNHESIFGSRGRDAFVTKLPLTGNALTFSGYLGGSGEDFASAIAVDANHAAWVIGDTYSKDFPIAGGPTTGQQRTYAGSGDAFLVKYEPAGTALAFSTYVGGSGYEKGYDVALAPNGSAYATGLTGSANFGTTTGRPCPGAYVVRLSANNLNKLFSTCLGPGEGYDIAVDSNLNAYVTGAALGPWPTTPGAFQTVQLTPHPNHNGFVTKVDRLGAVIYSTYLGGSDGTTIAAEIAVDSGGTAYVAGLTTSTQFPGTLFQTPNPSFGFLAKLAPQGNALQYSSLYGATAGGVALYQRTSRFGVFYPMQVYITGKLYSGAISYLTEDAYVRKLDESPVKQQ